MEIVSFGSETHIHTYIGSVSARIGVPSAAHPGPLDDERWKKTRSGVLLPNSYCKYSLYCDAACRTVTTSTSTIPGVLEYEDLVRSYLDRS